MAAWAFLRRKVSGARNYSWAELALVPPALLLLAAARLAIAILPLRLYRGWLGRVATDMPLRSRDYHGSERRARAVGRVVRATAAVTPWRADCLPQAMAAAALLRLAGAPYRLSIGWPDAEGTLEHHPMQAHAWLTVGDRVVTGGPVQPELKARLVFET